MKNERYYLHSEVRSEEGSAISPVQFRHLTYQSAAK
jgi:hypothetical protein